jgi:multiple sugar transport system substrate-binding protein
VAEAHRPAGLGHAAEQAVVESITRYGGQQVYRFGKTAVMGAALTAMVVSVAGCGGGTDASSSGSGSSASGGQSLAGRQITALVAGAGAGLQSQYDAYYKALAAEFNKETGSTVNFQFYSGGAEENSIIQTSLVSGSGPDVVGYGSSIGATLYGTNGFTTLSDADWEAVGGRDQWNEGTLTASGPDAKHDIGIPSFTVPYVIAYNTAMFQKAGITAAPTTWDEWMKDAEKVQAANPGVYGAGFDPADATDPWKFVWSYTHQQGGAFVSKDGKKAQLDSKQVQRAMDFYFSQFYENKVVPPDSLTWNNAQMIAAFTSGKVAMLPIATSGLLGAAKGSAVDGDIAFAQLPGVPAGASQRPSGGTAAASIVSGQFWAIFQYASKNKDLALALAKASNSEVVEKTQYEGLGWTPTTKDGIALVEKQYPDAKPFLDIESKQEATEFTPSWSNVQTGVSTTVNKVAQNLATSGKWDAGFLSDQLQQANAAVQATLK